MFQQHWRFRFTEWFMRRLNERIDTDSEISATAPIDIGVYND
jgi:hypothetical protein